MIKVVNPINRNVCDFDSKAESLTCSCACYGDNPLLKTGAVALGTAKASTGVDWGCGCVCNDKIPYSFEGTFNTAKLGY